MSLLLALLLFATAAATPAAPQPTFDAAATSLPPKFTGNDFEAVFQSLAVAPKGELETTAEADARKAKIGKARYAFVLRGDQLPPTYDADRETLTIKLYLSRAEVEGKTDHRPAFVVGQQQMRGNTYEATNAYGVKTTVTARETKELLLISRRQGETTVLVTLPVKVPRAEAAALQPRLRTMAVVELDGASALRPDPLVPEAYRGATGHTVHTPTIHEPQEVRTYEYALAGDLLGLWVFDEETGRVLGKFDPDGNPVASTTSVPRTALSPMQSYEIQRKIKSGMTKAEVLAIVGDEPYTSIQTSYAGEAAEAWAFEGLRFAVLFSKKKGTVITTR